MLLILNNDFIRQINYRSMISRISHSETDDKISRAITQLTGRPWYVILKSL